MKFGIVIFPGSNCDEDTVYALHVNLKQEVVKLWHKDKDLKGCDFIILPGGFSYGDYLRSGAIARFSPIMTQVIEHARGGGYLMGICNGFQILTEAGLVPGALVRNTNQKFVCKNIFLKLQTKNTLLTSALDNERAYKIPIAHGEGRFYADTKTLQKLNAEEQVLFRYCDNNGNITEKSNPNGSLENIAGVCNEGRNVFGMMPHPERASDPDLGNKDGMFLLNSIVENFVYL
ncbi:MAG: phosphoribosylformylglycinamidine synthase I [Bacteroidetes bacterium RIFCSPLOWO2_02_FULL_36_8]|nr:MAG: phosphoribosylformylglycinamidine synthase I [Bacteroidetes bacterium RIFCSPLOWO2_02_FULL_36_8]OFY71473.1 MAG: phosphoribosylformylglycinamidine synthase I [Bacteroidetes bacterium RIFCSPLOWO2_12_FULL_37_12]